MGFMTIWFMFFGYGIGNTGALLQISAWTADVVWRNSQVEVHWGYFALSVSILCAFLAWRGIQVAMKVSLVLSTYEAIVVVIMCIFIVVKGGAEGNYPLAWTPVGPYNGGVSGILQGLVYAITVFLGFELAAVLGEETKNPKKNIGIAVTSSILITLLYISFGVYAIIVAQGPSLSFDLIKERSPVDLFARKYVANWFGWLIDFAGISTCFTTLSAAFNNFYRLLYSFGREGILGLSVLGYTSPTTNTPVVAIVLWTTFVFTLAFLSGIFSFPVYTDQSSAGAWNAYGYMMFVYAIPLIFVFIATNIALPVFMYRKHREKFSVWRHVLIPLLSSMLLSLPIISNFYPSLPEPPYNYVLYIFFVWALIGVVLVLILRRTSGALEKIGSAFTH
eukprot:TRINITY_DN2439_c2_g1_i3.p1 TRINITY_DN2439_c2_g1~~TRINITY_DN2439_c2_g1_i3.p1  ORF type:complete len:391 (+),score=76.99 TRINITY_DN2439_c2_g1_i3:431-1603(+)